MAAATRVLLVVDALLLTVAAAPLLAVPDKSDDWFAWPVASPLTASLVGALLVGIAVLVVVSARAERWVDARLALGPVLAVGPLALASVLASWDSVRDDGWVHWAWIGVLAAVTVLGPALVLAQRIESSADDEGGTSVRRVDPPPPMLSGLVAVQAAALVAVGALLLLDPARVARMWPWALTTIDARTLGAVALALGLAAAGATIEGEPRRLRALAVSNVVLAVATVVALGRDEAELDWGRPMTLLLVAFVVVMAATGGWALAAGREPKLSEATGRRRRGSVLSRYMDAKRDLAELRR